MPVRFSIITPAFNSAATLRDTIESVRSQDYPDWEHIVIDGGSTDATAELLHSFPHLKWVSEKDEGHYDAMNKGIARTSGEFIVILNADDCFRPGALRSVADALQKNPGWDALFGDVLYVDGVGGTIYKREEAGYDYKVLLYGLDYICHQTMFVRKNVYERLGVYRQAEFRNSADYEFKLRLGRNGCRVGHVPSLLVNYRYHDRGQSADKRIIQNMMRETAVIRREHGNAGGWRGRVLSIVYKVKRQGQKLLVRHTCDLIPGTWRLKAHLREKTEFSSNSGLDKL